MPKIFISYRREDSQYQADRLHAALRKKIPKRDIFIDVDNIPVGADFVQHLDTQVAQCDLLLALIGPDWLGARNPVTGQRRLDDPKDFVRVEIASALKRGIAVAPILLDGAPFPAEADLPEDLKPLVRRNGVEIRRVSFDADAERMIRGLSLKPQPQPKPEPPRVQRAAAKPAAKPATKRKAGAPGWLVPVIVLALLAAGGGAYVLLANPFGAPAQTASTPQPVTPAVAATEPPPAPTPTASAAPPQQAAAASTTPAPPLLDRSPPTYKLERELTGHTGRTRFAAFSPDGARVVTASTDGTARVWDLATGKTVLTLSSLPASMNAALFTLDGLRIVTTSEDGVAQVWDATTGASLFKVKGIQGDPVMSRDGSLVADIGPQNRLIVWKTATGERVATLSKPAKGTRDWEESIHAMAFSPDGSRIVTASEDKTATVWDVRAGKPVLTLTGHGNDVRWAEFSRDGTRIVTAARDNTARVWDASTGALLLTMNHQQLMPVWSAEFSADGSRIVTASTDETAHVWDARTGASLLTLTHTDVVDRAFFSPDQARIVTASRDGCANVWDVQTGKRIARLCGGNEYSTIAISADGTRIVLWSAAWAARVWH